MDHLCTLLLVTPTEVITIPSFLQQRALFSYTLSLQTSSHSRSMLQATILSIEASLNMQGLEEYSDLKAH
jgi:hypothetical protein